ncbi:MAG: hypothetical protein DI585_02575 [Pseudomonas fluorescens]|nr:MAG: hypothetical protein DI585_02575 [Pseudomonas fluorescens]
MRYQFFFLLVCGLMANTSARAASNTYSEELELLAAGHSNQAYSLLRPKLMGSAGNPEFDTAFGMAALDSGATAEAIAALERVLAVQPSNLPVRTELARAYEKIGDVAAANRELQTVAQHPETPADVRKNLSRYASVLDETLGGGPTVIKATITATTGYDSNINTATNSSYITVPALASLGPARIDGGSQAQDSFYAEAGANLFMRKPITMSKAVFANVGVNQKTPFETSDYEQTVLTAEGGMQFTSPEHGRTNVSLGAQQFWFGGDDYSRTLSANINWLKPLDATSNLTVYGTLGHIDYAQNSDNNAVRGIAGITLDNRWNTALSPYVFGGVYGGMEDASKTDYMSYMLAGAMAGIEVFPWEATSVFADLRYELRDYDGEYPLFMAARKDEQWDVTLGMNHALTPNLMLRPTFAYRRTTSNIGFYDYSRWLANIGVRYVF